MTDPGGSAEVAGGGGMAGFDMEGLFNGIDGAIASNTDTQVRKEYERGKDPCTLVVAIAEALDVTYRPNMMEGARAAAVLSTELRGAADQAVAEKGRRNGQGGIDGYGGVTPFGKYLLDTGTVDVSRSEAAAVFLGGGPGTPGALIALGILHASVLDNMESRLGTGVPSGTNKGFKLGPGAYLYYSSSASDPENLERGKLQGSRIRRAYWEWRDNTRRTVYPLVLRPARVYLAGLVGTRGARYPFWAEGDGYPSSSNLGRVKNRIENLERMQRDYTRRCSQKQAADRADQRHLVDTVAGVELAAGRDKLLLGGAVAIVALAWIAKGSTK